MWGHSANDNGNGVPELLRDHLRRAAEYASCFAAAFDAEQQGYAAGLLHDLGKYADQFQRRLRDNREPARDHWTAGALALLTCHKKFGLLSACASRGHHVGLDRLPAGFPPHKDYQEQFKRIFTDPNLCSTLTETDTTILKERFERDGFEIPRLARGLSLTGHNAADMLDVRMLFSTLVDADFLATEGHFNGNRQTPYRPREEGAVLDIDRAIDGFNAYLARIRQARGDDPMAKVREELFVDCMAASENAVGAFTLSAPTGSGKTLAMLAFALHHAKRHHLRRIVLVMPFLNIIDQTAKIYREIFSEEQGFAQNTVLEHHSLTDDRTKKSDDKLNACREEQDVGISPRLLTENWDAPIILTTNVQLLESLMADRPSRCRKLHRLAQSVILCDEVQALPQHLAVATLATLSRLTDSEGPYQTSLVFATATQPAFDSLNRRIAPEFVRHGWQPTEIVRQPQALYAAASHRVRISWRHQQSISKEDIASELQKHPQVLCIVNLKRHAAELMAILQERGLGKPEGLLHLSTNMCPAHREKTLKEVVCRLKQGQPVCLIATQCVEAGVDLDFPVVYRALAPLEAIAQAAGRCNRHGYRGQGRNRPGQVVVFKPHDTQSLYPPGYKQAVNATETFLNNLAIHGDLDAVEILGDPQKLHDYYCHFYSLTGMRSSETAGEVELVEAIRGGNFEDVAKHYKLIENNTIRVLVSYEPAIFEQLRDEIVNVERFTPDFIRNWVRRASPYAVNLFRPNDSTPVTPFLEPIRFSHRSDALMREADWFYTLPDLKYDRLCGISTNVENLWIM
jgi:CRISPR-associated helicase Cas3/CRISPR-associated endonuclease Cas3-HD